MILHPTHYPAHLGIEMWSNAAFNPWETNPAEHSQGVDVQAYGFSFGAKVPVDHVSLGLTSMKNIKVKIRLVFVCCQPICYFNNNVLKSDCCTVMLGAHLPTNADETV